MRWYWFDFITDFLRNNGNATFAELCYFAANVKRLREQITYHSCIAKESARNKIAVFLLRRIDARTPEDSNRHQAKEDGAATRDTSESIALFLLPSSSSRFCSSDSACISETVSWERIFHSFIRYLAYRNFTIFLSFCLLSVRVICLPAKNVPYRDLVYSIFWLCYQAEIFNGKIFDVGNFYYIIILLFPFCV